MSTKEIEARLREIAIAPGVPSYTEEPLNAAADAIAILRFERDEAGRMLDVAGAELYTVRSEMERLRSAKEIIKSAWQLVEAIKFDDSGEHGRGGNGGLISKETIRKADNLRVLLLSYQKEKR